MVLVTLKEGERILFAESLYKAQYTPKCHMPFHLVTKGIDYIGGFYTEIKFLAGDWLLVRHSFKAINSMYFFWEKYILLWTQRIYAYINPWFVKNVCETKVSLKMFV